MSDGKKPMSTGMKVGLGIVGVIVLLIVIGSSGGADKKSDSVAVADTPATEQVREALTVTAAELSSAFQENEAKAKLAYDGNVLRVTGVVKDITLDFADDPVIALKGAGDEYDMGVSQSGKMTDVNVNGLAKETAAQISKGAEITFECDAVTEVMGSPQLNGCTVAK